MKIEFALKIRTWCRHLAEEIFTRLEKDRTEVRSHILNELQNRINSWAFI